MKTLLTILLLLTHSLLWGQDTIRFEPLEITDTIWSENIEIKDSSDILWSSDDDLIVGLNYGELALVAKHENFWIKYKFDVNGYLVSFENKEQFLFINSFLGYGGRPYTHSYYYLTIIDLKLKTVSEPLITSQSNEVDIYNPECNSRIIIESDTLYCETECDIFKYSDNNGETKTSKCECSLPTGEYHYINGNFVKVKPKE